MDTDTNKGAADIKVMTQKRSEKPKPFVIRRIIITDISTLRR